MMIKVLIKVSKSGIIDISITSKLNIVGIMESRSNMASIARIVKKQRMPARSA